jgi:hypothetical protein
VQDDFVLVETLLPFPEQPRGTASGAQDQYGTEQEGNNMRPERHHLPAKIARLSEFSVYLRVCLNNILCFNWVFN